MVNRKGIIAARKVFEETGYDALADISINDFALGLGAFVKEEPLSERYFHLGDLLLIVR